MWYSSTAGTLSLAAHEGCWIGCYPQPPLHQWSGEYITIDGRKIQCFSSKQEAQRAINLWPVYQPYFTPRRFTPLKEEKWGIYYKGERPGWVQNETIVSTEPPTYNHQQVYTGLLYFPTKRGAELHLMILSPIRPDLYEVRKRG